MKKLIAGFEFFEIKNIEVSVLELLDADIAKSKSFGFMGINSNKFYREFDPTQFDRNTEIIKSISSSTEYVFRIKENRIGNVDEFLFFTDTSLPLISTKWELVRNFEFVIIYFSDEAFDKYTIEDRMNGFSFRSIFSPRRWTSSDSFVRVTADIAHNQLYFLSKGSFS